ncbi:MAG: hypothetical protein K9N07_06695 [Candidatus Cloacimonetes bacterium]|nr:hypothetical protein [Candidatus Cloacimonadota bacterium]
MNYALRNTLILSVLLVLVITGFLLGNNSSVKRVNLIRTNYENNLKQLNELKAAHPDMQDQDIFLESLQELEERVKKESKFIPNRNNPTITYKYLLDICDRFDIKINFNFLYNRLSKIEDISYYTYTINGTAPTHSFYSFIYQIENQFMLYVIESIKIKEEIQEDKTSGFVNFTIVLNAYFDEKNSETGEVPFRKLVSKNLVYDPFYSRIHAPFPDERQRKFLDLYSASMIGLTPNKVFMKDNTGRIHILKIGDKVAYGSLGSINWDEQYAVFKVNEIGIIKDKKIYLNELKEE